MKTVLHKADTRGNADHGWLKAHHTFSFAGYHDESRLHFGMLRVLNDDEVAAGMGFGMHPHDNMEIITIPLSGALQHRDNMGNTSVITKNEVQVMSAGTGVMHSEFNPSKTESTKLLQIWVFPGEENVTPRYDQKVFNADERKNNFQLIVSPENDNGSLMVHQQTWFSLIHLDKNKSADYILKNKSDGVYVFVIEGEIKIGEINLNKRDGLGIAETEKFTLAASADSELLLMEVPLN